MDGGFDLRHPLLICISIVSHPSALASVYSLWRVYVERSVALQLEYPAAGTKEARDDQTAKQLVKMRRMHEEYCVRRSWVRHYRNRSS